ncbi:MAG: hypothetical protein B7733_11075 [Myxococcales bacterium FL481]|nr:MAG: hypothetical protein B7733_11075 [Myxococcales bacterium FL481]
MSTIREQIDARLRQARLDRDEPTKTVIGMLKAKALVALKDGSGREEDDALWQSTLSAYAKELKKSMAAYAELGERGAEPIAAAQFELDFCQQYMPKKLDEAETEALVRKVAADNGITDTKGMGRLMGAVMKTHRDQVDADLVKAAAARVLAG